MLYVRGQQEDYITGSIAAEERDIAGFEPGHGGGMQAGRCLRHVPRPECGATRPAAGTNEHGITGTHDDTGHFFEGIQVFLVDRRSRLQIVNPLEKRDVYEYTSGDDATLQIGNRVGRACLRGGCASREWVP